MILMMIKYGISEQATPISAVIMLSAYSPRRPSASSKSHEKAERFGSEVLFIVRSFDMYYVARCFFTIRLPMVAPIKAAEAF